MHALLASKDFAVSELSDYVQALPVLDQLGTSSIDFRGMVRYLIRFR